MTHRSRNSSSGDDGVGYGKPPTRTRFRKDVSGNPGGRPRCMTAGRATALAIKEALSAGDGSERRQDSHDAGDPGSREARSSSLGPRGNHTRRQRKFADGRPARSKAAFIEVELTSLNCWRSRALIISRKPQSRARLWRIRAASASELEDCQPSHGSIPPG
jgi:hypothetical protein